MTEAQPLGRAVVLPVRDYDLAATLDSGQAFRWHRHNDSWSGVIGRRWVRLTPTGAGLQAQTAQTPSDWQWLRDYLQTEVHLADVLKTFPDDPPMRAATAACPGLRVLRQDPWECLASFILSATKQIVQIRQIIGLLCQRFGQPIAEGLPRPLNATEAPPAAANPHSHAFPTPDQIASATETQLRACKAGFRAPHLLAAARQIAAGQFDLDRLGDLPLAQARGQLMQLHGVGAKIADCVLLFAFGFAAAFPMDVWVERALRQLYFPHRRVTPRELRHFAATHFGPFAGYAQQYLFHYMRTRRD